MALFGERMHLGTFRQIPDLLAHFNVDDEVWTAVVTHLGGPRNHIHLLSALPSTAIIAACGLAQTSRGALTPVEATQVGLVWRMSRRIAAFHSGMEEDEFVDEDPWKPKRDTPPSDKPKPSGSGLKEHVFKMG